MNIQPGSETPIRVLAFYDVEGWAWWHRAHQIKKNLPPDIQMDIQKIHSEYDHRRYDLIMLFDYYHLSEPGWIIPPPDKLIVGCSCPKLLEEAVIVIQIANCLAGIVNNLAGFKQVEHTGKFYCCQNGVDEELFYPSTNLPTEFRACWVGNPDSIGNKGLDLINRACEISATPRMTLATNATLAKPMPQEQVRDELYHQSSCYICASEWEGTPNPGLESLACGLPVISTRVGNMVELIQDGQNGFLVDRSAESIAAALTKLRSMDQSQLRRNARESILNGWTWSAQTQKYAAMFRELAARVRPQWGLPRA